MTDRPHARSTADSPREGTGPGRPLKVGDLARRTGLTVRTLHHWDQIGLLVPDQRTPSGHRLYGPGEVRRLQRIMSLRALDLGLDQIAARLDDPDSSLVAVLQEHRDRIKDRGDELRRLEQRLTWLLDAMAGGSGVTEEDLLETMEMMTMMEEHYTPEQLERLATRKEALGPDAIQEVQEEWPRLIASVREAMEKGKEPTSEHVLTLAKRWSELIQAFTGGDKGIEASLGSMYQAEPKMAESQGMDPALFQYIGAAMKALKEGE